MIEKLRFRNCPDASMLDILKWSQEKRCCGNRTDPDCYYSDKLAEASRKYKPRKVGAVQQRK